MVSLLGEVLSDCFRSTLPYPSSPRPSGVPELSQVLQLSHTTCKQGWVAASEPNIQICSLGLSEVQTPLPFT